MYSVSNEFSSNKKPVHATPVNKSSISPLKKKHRFQKFFLICAFFIVLAIFLSLFIISGWVILISVDSSEKILDGIYSGGQYLGGKTITEATLILHKNWNLNRNIEVSDGLMEKGIPPQDLGLLLNPVETAKAAYDVGRKGSFWKRLQQITLSNFYPLNIPATVSFDPSIARAGLEKLSSEFSKPAVEASLSIKNGNVISEPGKYGYEINIPESMEILSNQPIQVFSTGKLKLIIKPTMPEVMDLSGVVDEAQHLLDTPHAVIFHDPLTNEDFIRDVSDVTFAEWITITNFPDTRKIGLDTERIGIYLAKEKRNLGSGFTFQDNYEPIVSLSFLEGKNPVIELQHLPTTYIVQPGDTLLKISWRVGIPFWRISEANPVMNPDGLIAGQEIILPSKDDLVPLPIIRNKRIVIEIGKQRLWAFENGIVVRKEIISTGIDRSPTQPGIFQVQTHVSNAYASVWDLHMPNFLGIYEAWPGFMNGIHGLPTLSNGRRLWAEILGKPASYGCIILDIKAAEWLFEWAEDGTIVEIKP